MLMVLGTGKEGTVRGHLYQYKTDYCTKEPEAYLAGDERYLYFYSDELSGIHSTLSFSLPPSNLLPSNLSLPPSLSLSLPFSPSIPLPPSLLSPSPLPLTSSLSL